MSYDHENKIIIIFYNNTNIDLIKNNNIINIPDVKNKTYFRRKKIHNTIIEKGIAILLLAFGLLLVDLVNEEIIDTYKIGEDGNTFNINDCYIDDTCIFVLQTMEYILQIKNSNKYLTIITGLGSPLTQTKFLKLT